MAFVTLPTPIIYPSTTGVLLTPANYVVLNATPTFTFDAATDELCLVTRVPFTGTLTEMGFRTGTVSTAGADFTMGLYTVDASGLPTTTAYATNSHGNVTVGTGDDNVWKAVSINSGTGVSVTRGDLVAIRLFVASGTPNTVQINGPGTTLSQTNLHTYRVENTTGSAAKSTSANPVPFYWNYGGAYYACDGCTPASSGAYTTISNGAERGLQFQVPVPLRICGVTMALGNIAAGADFTVYLLSGTAPYTTEKSVAVDGDAIVAATSDGFVRVLFDTDEELLASTNYFIVVRANTANVVQTIDWTCPGTAAMAAMPGGENFQLVARDATAVTNNTAFTVTNTVQPHSFLLVNGIDVSAGGGGLLTHPGMGGGMRG